MKNQMKKILLAEFLILLVYLVFFMTKRDDILTRLETPLDAWNSSYVDFQEGEWKINSEVTSSYVTFLYGPYIEVPKGDYTVTVCYECDTDQDFQPFVYETNKGYLKSSTMTLDQASNIVSCDFRVTEDIDNFQLSFWYNGKGELSISGISIDRNDNDLRRNIVYLLFLFLIVNLIFYYRKLSIERRKYFLAILSISGIAAIPVFYTGLSGHDLIFHLTRIEGLARELSYGNFPVRMQSVWMAEYGYPVSIYYGDVLLYIPAVFRLLGFTIDQAYKMFLLVVNFAGVIIAEQCFKRMFRKQSTTLLLTLVYVTASYHLVDIYVRAAVGEYCALIFLPLLALAVYNIYCKGKNDTFKKNIINASIMAVGMTGIITAHVLSAEMAAFALLLVCLVYLKKTFSLNAIRTYLMAVIETLLMSAGFLVPFLDYYLNVSVEITEGINQGAARTIQDKGANLGDFFAFFSDPFGDWYTMLFNPGIVLMLTLGAAVAIWAIQKATREIKTMTVLSVIMLFMATNVFPWNSLAHDFVVFDFLAEVQFPWRYIGVSIIFLTLLLGFILEDSEIETYLKINKNTIVGMCAIVSIAMTCVFVGYYADHLKSNVYYHDIANMGTWSVMGGEYMRTNTNLDDFDGKIYSKDIENVEIISRVGCNIDIRCKTEETEGIITLPVLNYKGYVVTDDAGHHYEITNSENNLIAFTLPANFDGTIHLRFVEPWYWTVSFAVSVTTVAMILGVSFYNELKKSKKER